MEIHDFAKIFPMMNDGTFGALVDDIRKNGLNEPILTFEGKILDGRNRFQACIDAGVEPRFRDLNGATSEKALQIVIGNNLHRRHLDKNQRAIAAVQSGELTKRLRAEAKARQIATLPKQGEKGFQSNVTQKIEEHKNDDKNVNTTDQILAETFGTNRQYIADARKIIEQSPEKANEILEGKTTIPKAKKEIQAEQNKTAVLEQEQGEKIKKELSENERKKKQAKMWESVAKKLNLVVDYLSKHYNPPIEISPSIEADIKLSLDLIKDHFE